MKNWPERLSNIKFSVLPPSFLQHSCIDSLQGAELEGVVDFVDPSTRSVPAIAAVTNVMRSIFFLMVWFLDLTKLIR